MEKGAYIYPAVGIILVHKYFIGPHYHLWPVIPLFQLPHYRLYKETVNIFPLKCNSLYIFMRKVRRISCLVCSNAPPSQTGKALSSLSRTKFVLRNSKSYFSSYCNFSHRIEFSNVRMSCIFCSIYLLSHNSPIDSVFLLNLEKCKWFAFHIFYQCFFRNFYLVSLPLIKKQHYRNGPW